jgi:hypothetical protein
MSTPDTATPANASTTNVSSVKAVAPNDKITSSITKSQAATASSTAANRYQRMIQYDHVRKNTILFCGINDEETIGSMVNYLLIESSTSALNDDLIGLSRTDIIKIK